MKKTKKDIAKKINQKELENPQLIKQVELILKKQRGYVFKMPKRNSSVVLQISGGIDSVSLASYLIEKYKLIVYPVYINRGHGRAKKELESLAFFDRYFLKRYPKKYKPLFVLNTKIPPWEIRKEIIQESLKFVKKNSVQKKGIPVYTSLLTSFSVQYAKYLESIQNTKIKTIFCAAIHGDGDYVAHHSLTGMRGVMLNICLQTNDFSWQFTSPLVEKELGMFHGKEHLVEIGNSYSLPLEKTWSCYKNQYFHCGWCDSCQGRREAFRKANVKDKTVYMNNHSWKGILKNMLLEKINKINEKNLFTEF